MKTLAKTCGCSHGSPTDVLRAEHRVIERVLDALEVFAAQDKIDAGRVRIGIEFLRNFADGCHHAKEENELFPRLEAAGIPRDGGPIGCMLDEHARGRELIQVMLANVDAAAAGKQDSVAALRDAVTNYVTLLRQHIWKEDNVLFDMAERVLQGCERGEVLRGFERTEQAEANAGKHDRYIQIAEALYQAAQSLRSEELAGARKMTGSVATYTSDRAERWIDFSTIAIVARKEIRDALRNRWFLLYAVCFGALSLALSYVALAGTGTFGMAGFGRTAASIINLSLLVVPLMGLTIGANAIAGERERGTLEALLSQPISRVEIILGKFIGSAIALAGALALGFGATAALLAFKGSATNVSKFVSIFALSVLLGWSMLSVGFLISSVARKSSLALGVAVFVWLAFVFLGDLGLMGSAVALNFSTQELLAYSLLNPLQVFKMFAVSGIHRSLDLLGPAGLYASQTWGRTLPVLLGSVLAAWIVAPMALATLVFSRRALR